MKAAELVEEDVRVDIVTRDAAQVIVTIELMNMIMMMKTKILIMKMILMINMYLIRL